MQIARRFCFLLALAAGVAGSPGFVGDAAAFVSADVASTPQMRAWLGTPAMRKGRAAARRQNWKAAASYYLSAAKKGNPIAEVVMGRLYFEGRGVPKNVMQSLTWLKAAMMQKQEPAFTLAVDTLKTISDTLKASPDPTSKQEALIALVLPLVAIVPPGWHPAGDGGLAGALLLHGMLGGDDD